MMTFIIDYEDTKNENFSILNLVKFSMNTGASVIIRGYAIIKDGHLEYFQKQLDYFLQIIDNVRPVNGKSRTH